MGRNSVDRVWFSVSPSTLRPGQDCVQQTRPAHPLGKVDTKQSLRLESKFEEKNSDEKKSIRNILPCSS